MAETLLLADDEEKVLEFMSSFLREEGFRIVTARTGTEALALADKENPALVVLDWMMPQMSGLDACRELRKRSRAGIIMVTAKSDEMDKIIGLEVGADDYIVKPFSLRELLARIRSVLRRLQDSPAAEERLVRGDLIISSSQHRVWKRGVEIGMTPTEFKLLLTLAVKPGIVYSRLQLLKAALDDDLINVERTVDAHISRLRKKIEDDLSNPRYIETVYGFGYRFGGQT
ncbi:DNA-binding response regulator [Cohnella xylanilytica]|uniref:response regulator n=1 Tax=Cohnella xylanilytica TaxID=557555 RepID=UPI001B2DD229|nr:response regulator transcription factor [Cohnella xylanilytica]GIO16579.1 DNA-binding response regulator [Cohnella xylanilytica]